jgi:N-acetyl-gamma-glutamyl-phosphate reductase
MGNRVEHLRAAVVGASGYSGAEVVRLLSRRPDVDLTALVAHSAAGQPLDALYPDLTGTVGATLTGLEQADLGDADVVFIALPSGEGMAVAESLIAGRARIIDLGGDLRLKDTGLYRRSYGHEHVAPGALREAVYGLPELHREAICTARVVANPGCYPTGALLALLPALQAGLVETEGISICSMSGVSGAGRSAKVEMSFAEVNENLRAYKVLAHQHVPEIESVLGEVAGTAVAVSFIPHLVPLTRGIHTTIHCRLRRPVGQEEVQALYRDQYASAPFVRVRTGPPEVRAVAHTNYFDVFPAVNERTGQLVLLSVIDNLVKGAAGQAVQNMNLMFGFPEDHGLRGRV